MWLGNYFYVIGLFNGHFIFQVIKMTSSVQIILS